MSSEEEESDAPTCNGDDDHDVMGPKKKKPRLLHRRNLRAVKKGLSVDSFNPDTLTTHTEELKRIERLESHPQNLIGTEVTTDSDALGDVSSDNAYPLLNGNENGIIVLSDSDNDDVADGKKPTRKPYRRQSSSLKYSESLPLGDGSLVINLGHPSNEQDIHLPPQIASVVKPHQVGIFIFILCLTLFVHRSAALDFCMITL